MNDQNKNKFIQVFVLSQNLLKIDISGVFLRMAESEKVSQEVNQNNIVGGNNKLQYEKRIIRWTQPSAQFDLTRKLFFASINLRKSDIVT